MRWTTADVNDNDRQNLFYVNLKMTPNVAELLKIKPIERLQVTSTSGRGYS